MSKRKYKTDSSCGQGKPRVDLREFCQSADVSVGEKSSLHCDNFNVSGGGGSLNKLNNKMITKLEKRFLFIAFAIMFIGGIFMIAKWSDNLYKTAIDGKLINQPLYKISSFELETDKQVYKGGETILVRWDMCKGTNDVATISVNLKNHVVTQMVEVKGTKTAGCFQSWDTIVPVIPTNLLSGEYYAEIDIAYQVNPLAVIHYRFTTKKFLIDNN